MKVGVALRPALHHALSSPSATPSALPYHDIHKAQLQVLIVVLFGYLAQHIPKASM
jgi:hypothetical protein